MHAEENPLDIGLNPVGEQALVSPQSHDEKESNKESDQEKTKNQVQHEKRTNSGSNCYRQTVFSAEKF